MIETREESIQRIVSVINAHQRFLVATHVRPDGDAVGSVLAMTAMLRKLGKDADAYCQDPPPPTQEFLFGVKEMLHDGTRVSDYEVVILVDCGDLERVGDALATQLDQAGLLINIDHHISSKPFGDIYWVEGGASSTCEMLFELSRAIPLELDALIAAQLYTGILMDTGSFRFANTTTRALEIAAALVDAGAQPGFIAEQVYDSISPNRLQLLAEVLGSLEYHADQRVVTGTITPEMYIRTSTSYSDSDSFITYLRSVKTVQVAMLFRQESDGIVYASLRSKGEVDVANFAERYGGGGHRRAAALRVRGDFDRTCKQITEAMLRYLEVDGDLQPSG
jgi:bifunctional oligoribonuclease and PAP phosphatase NrnA